MKKYLASIENSKKEIKILPFPTVVVSLLVCFVPNFSGTSSSLLLSSKFPSIFETKGVQSPENYELM